MVDEAVQTREADPAIGVTRLRLASAGCAAGFVVLALLVSAGWGPLIALDHAWSAAAFDATLSHTWLEAPAHVATFLGNGWTITAITAVVVLACLARRRWWLAGWLAVTVAGGSLLSSLVKRTIERARPDSADVLTSAHGFAFPSGHTTAATVTYVAVVLVVAWRLWTPGRGPRHASVAVVVLLVGLVGLSRVFLGAHWPSDVLGGWLLGSAWVTFATLVLLWVLQRESRAVPLD